MFCSKSTMLGTSKSIWGFEPRSIPGCTLWLDGADNATMNSTTAVTVWNDKSGQSNTMTGTGTWSNGTMVFNGTTNAFSNLAYVFPFGAYSMFAVYSNTTAPASNAYMNAVYGSDGFPMLGTFGSSRFVSARSVVANTGALVGTTQVGWAARMAGTDTAIGYGVATDSSGNVIVTGRLGGGVLTVFDSSGVSNASFTSVAGNDCFLAKYSSTGAVLWAAQIGGGNTDTANAIATDSSGNMFVTGVYGGAGFALTLYNTGGTIGGTLAASSGTSDVFIARYTSAGAVSWGARIASTGADVGTAVATDPSGNVFVTGYYDATLTLFNSSGVSNASLPITGGTDGFIAKYSSAGSVLWAARIAGTGTANDRVNGIATDSSGSAFVTGIYTATLTLFNSSGVSNASLPFAGGVDCFVAKYTSDGAVSWAAQIAGATTSSDFGYGIATDSSGNVFVTGQYGAALTLYNTGGSTGATLASTATNDVFVAKYSSTGSVLWAARIAGSGADTGAAIATDSSGNVLVTGFHGATLTLFNSSGVSNASLPFAGGVDCFVAKYSADGAVLWGVQIAGTSTSFDQGLAVAADSSGNVFVTGQYGAVLTLRGANGASNASLTFSSGTSGVFLAKYNPDGYIANAPTPASSNVLVSATYTPSTFSPFVNGFTQSTLAGTTLATTGLFLGGPSNYFSGSISEVLVFGTTLTAAQRQSVEGYLSRKWGIGTRLIITHPYYTIPPFNRYFNPTDVPGCSLWLDGADNSSMNSTTTVTSWSDKSGSNNTMTGTATWTGRSMSFNGSTQAFSNTGYVFPNSAYSMFAVYSNTTAPASGAYMNAMYGSNGYPVIGILGASNAVWTADPTSVGTNGWNHVSSDSTGSNLFATENYSNLWSGRFNGTNWTWTRLLSGTNFAASAASSNGSNVALAAGINFYTGVFNGTTWTFTQHAGAGTGLPSSVSAFYNYAVCDYSGSNVVTSQSPGFVYTGRFNGSTWAWTQQASPGSNAWPLFSLASDSTGSNIAVARGTGSNIWTARRVGVGSYTWTQQTSWGSNFWSSIALSSNGSNLVVGANASGFSSGTFNGTSWSFGAIPGSPTSSGTKTIALSASGSNFVTIASSGFVHTASFNGSTWTFFPQISLGSINVAIPAIASDATGNILSAATSNVSGPAYILTTSNASVALSLPYVFTAPLSNLFLRATIPTTPANSNVLVSVNTSNTTHLSYTNGLQNIYAAAGATAATTGIRVGGPSNYFNGTISELLIYSSTLSAAQRQQVEGYLIQKWGLSAQTVAGHPYKLIPPATVVP